MDTEQALSAKLTGLSFLVFGIAAVAGIIGLTGITSFPAALIAIPLILTSPFYYLITLGSVFVNSKADKKALDALTEEEIKAHTTHSATRFATKSQENTFASTAALTVIIPAVLTLLGFMVFKPDNGVDIGAYDSWMMVIGTAFVIPSIWLGISNHRNLFDKNQRLAQKLALKNKTYAFKTIRLNLIWSRIIWNIGGILSIIALYSFLAEM